MALFTVALMGNPNSGKTTVFNALTGAHQKVSNWPGVTVEKKEGVCHWGPHHLHVVDLPGTYGLSAYSLDERIARDFVLLERPNVVVDVVDASNLERNLYLLVQLLEITPQVVVDLNMMDVARSRGVHIDSEALSRALGVPVVPTVARRGQGLERLKEAIVQVAEGRWQSAPLRVDYGLEVEEELRRLEELVRRRGGRSVPPRWAAIGLLEGDPEVIELLRG